MDIVHERSTRSYRTQERREIISYIRETQDHIIHGLRCKEVRRKKEMMQSDVSAYEMKSKHNITPLSGSTSTATSLILIHENTQPRPVDCFDVLVDMGSCEELCTSSYS